MNERKQHIRRTTAEAESQLAEEKTRAEGVSIASQRGGHQAVARLRGDAWFRSARKHCPSISQWDGCKTTLLSDI